MDNQADIGTPVPASTETSNCPECGRKLLTRSSMLCNWCGAKINDTEYQQKAAEARQAADEAIRKSLEAAKADTEKYGKFGTMFRRNKDKKKVDDGTV